MGKLALDSEDPQIREVAEILRSVDAHAGPDIDDLESQLDAIENGETSLQPREVHKRIEALRKQAQTLLDQWGVDPDYKPEAH